MRKMFNLRRSEAGQILIFVTIVLAVAALIIPAALGLTYAGHRSTQMQKEDMQQYYAADTGVEDALHKMGNGNFSMGQPYEIPGGVNGYGVSFVIEQIGVQSYRITSTATDPVDGTNTEVVTDVPIYTLTISSSDGGNVTEPGEGIFPYPGGLTVPLLAVPDDDCHDFVNWTGNTSTISDVNAAGGNITMNGNYTITANFKWQRLLTVSSTTGGRVSVTPPGHDVFPFPDSPQTFGYCDGWRINLVAIADGSHTFMGWTGPVYDPGANSTYIDMNGDYEIQANFVAITQYTLTVSPNGNGHVTSPGESPPTYTYPEHQVVTLQAVANPGSAFVNWTGDTGTIGNVTAAFTTITMNGNYNIVAYFSSYSLTISHGVGGHVTEPGEGIYYYAPGTVVNLGATADAGYQFGNWTGGPVASPNSATTTITMNGDYSIVANFNTDAFCYPCFHYAVAALGGTGNPPFVNSGDVTGDIYVAGDAQMYNSFYQDGILYVNGDLELRNTIDLAQDIHVNGNLIIGNHIQVYGNAYVNGDITLTNTGKIWGNASSTGSISIENNSRIYGDAHYEGTIDIKSGSSVGGNQYHDAVVELPGFPQVSPPSPGDISDQAQQYKTEAISTGLTKTGSLSVSGTYTLGGAGHYSYITGDLTISNNAQVTIAGTIFVEGKITISNNCVLTVANNPNPAARYAIVANGNIVINNGSDIVATDELPIIMSASGGISAAGSSDIEGALYAPAGSITLGNSVNVYGSVVGLTVSASSSTTITHAPELDGGQGAPACGCSP